MESAEPNTNNQEERKGDAGNPGPVYGEKDQAPNPREHNNRKQQMKRKIPGKQKQLAKYDKPIAPEAQPLLMARATRRPYSCVVPIHT